MDYSSDHNTGTRDTIDPSICNGRSARTLQLDAGAYFGITKARYRMTTHMSAFRLPLLNAAQSKCRATAAIQLRLPRHWRQGTRLVPGR